MVTLVFHLAPTLHAHFEAIQRKGAAFEERLVVTEGCKTVFTVGIVVR